MLLIIVRLKNAFTTHVSVNLSQFLKFHIVISISMKKNISYKIKYSLQQVLSCKASHVCDCIGCIFVCMMVDVHCSTGILMYRQTITRIAHHKLYRFSFHLFSHFVESLIKQNQRWRSCGDKRMFQVGEGRKTFHFLL